MALQKRSRLHKLLLTFDEDGVYVNGEALFQEGAWNTETLDWEGKPIAREYPVHNMDPDGKKFLNDVIGVAATKALETASVAAEAMKAAKERAESYIADANKAHADLKDALGARDNFAALEKETRGKLIEARGWDMQRAEERDALDIKLRKIPGLIRRMFGAI